MNRHDYDLWHNYMKNCIQDSAHDTQHIYRVLSNALRIASAEANVDYDVLICACLLHDIGRAQQLKNPELCHAQIGSQMAFSFLIHSGYPEAFAVHVKECILSHRYRKATPPTTPEAKILFDADKLDVTGALGIARTLQYHGAQNAPLYSVASEDVSSASDKTSFFTEYNYKLKNLYTTFYTATGAELARKRKKAAEDFYEALLSEVQNSALDLSLLPDRYKNEN